MKAVSMSISIPVTEKCNKNCPFCISKMTTPVGEDILMWHRNLDKAKTIAKLSGVSSVILTGKHDPLQNMELVQKACEKFNNFPLEIQTNGKLLTADTIRDLYSWKMDTIAISVNSIPELYALESTIESINTLGMTVRLVFNTTDMLTKKYFVESTKPEDALLWDIILFCKRTAVTQVSFRSVTIPLQTQELAENSGAFLKIYPEAVRTMNWIEKHARGDNDVFLEYLNNELKKEGTRVCSLPYGANIVMFHDISFTYFDYCIQDESGEDDIRSLIYFDDGHMSRSWNGSNYGRVF